MSRRGVRYLMKRKFDRFPSRDQRRGNFMLRDVLPGQEREVRTWFSWLTTDQGREGACVGHGNVTDAAASPRPLPRDYVPVETANQYAQGWYKRAQELDPWAGEAYDGTSVDAGLKVARERGVIDSWRWMYDVDEVRDAVLAVGPVVLGINWYEDMYDTRPSGLVTVGGPKVGGHCITIIGYHPGMRIAGEDYNQRYEVFKWKNSWGNSYGKNGVGYLRASDLDELLQDDGEAAVGMGRHRFRIQT
jgi:hypothetical protein